MKMKRILMLCFAALMAVGMAACDKENENNGGNNNGGNNGGGNGGNNNPTTLVGTTWQDATGFISFSFSTETTVSMSSAGNSMDGTYTYNAAAGTGTINIAGVMNYTFSISGNTMSIMNANGEVTFMLQKVEGNQNSTEMSNTTWMYLDNATGHTHMLMFNASDGVVYNHNWYFEDNQGEVDEGEWVYMGSYTYADGHGTLTLNNVDPDAGGAATLTGSFRVAEDALQLTLSDGTDVTLTRYNMPGR